MMTVASSGLIRKARKSNRISQSDFYYLVINLWPSVDGPEIIRDVSSSLFISLSFSVRSRHTCEQSPLRTELDV